MQQPMDYSALIKLAQSPTGQKLLTILQRSGTAQLQQAMDKASKGDYSSAQKDLAPLLEDPEVKRLLEQLGGKK